MTTRRKTAIATQAIVAVGALIIVAIRISEGHSRLGTAIAVLIVICACRSAWITWKEPDS
jgi:hypothetical protein